MLLSKAIPVMQLIYINVISFALERVFSYMPVPFNIEISQEILQISFSKERFISYRSLQALS